MSWKEITEIATDVNSGKVTATDNVKSASSN